MEVRVELSRIIINEAADQQIIVLKEIGGDRSFPIVIGVNEILAIDRRLKGFMLERPMTHDLLANVIEASGGMIDKVLISDISEHTFYAELHIDFNGRKVKVDSRPSDALAIAVGVDVPIFVDEQVFEKLKI
ncbi:MAG: bifunctional nuclease family protein [Anaerohalosphaera sp.]|nr:bifunctional nuclease family protein [Anaerohalosphaera sp.]